MAIVSCLKEATSNTSGMKHWYLEYKKYYYIYISIYKKYLFPQMENQ